MYNINTTIHINITINIYHPLSEKLLKVKHSLPKISVTNLNNFFG